MPDITANGVRLYYEEQGVGEPIVCIHGTSSSALMWRQASRDALAEMGRLIVYDRRGCTRSERPQPYATSVGQHAEDAMALLEAIHAHPVVIIGRSYGGAVALGVTLREPQLVRGLVLLEPGDVGFGDERSGWEVEMVRIVESAAASDPSSVSERLIRYVLGDEAWASMPHELKRMFADNSPAVLAETRGPGLEVSLDELAGIAVPTLVVAGASSASMFRHTAERLADAIPDARLAMVGGGHLIDPGDPQVLGFVHEVLGAPGAGLPGAAR